MRIVHYINSTATAVGGPARFALDAARLMADAGHDFTLLSWDTSGAPKEWLDDGHSRCSASKGVAGGLPSVCAMGSPRRDFMFGMSAMRSLRDHLRRADVLHLHGVFDPSNVQVAAIAKAMGVPYVVTSHGMLDDWCMAQKAFKKRAFMSVVGRRYLDGAARVHFTAQAERDQSMAWCPDSAETIVPYLFDLEPYRDLPGRQLAEKRFEFLREKDEPTVLFLSRLHHKKGPELLIQAASMLRQWGIKGKVALAGMGEAEYISSLQSLATSLGIAEDVRLLGPVAGAEKVSLYQSADLFVLPTSQENFGLVLIEAMASGTPLITTKGVDIWKDLEGSGGAEIVDQRPEQLAGSIAALLQDRVRREDMASKARPWVFNTFDPAKLCGSYERLYTDAVA